MYKWRSMNETVSGRKDMALKYGREDDMWHIDDNERHPFLGSVQLVKKDQDNPTFPFSITIQASSPWNKANNLELKKRILEKGGEELQKLNLDCSEFGLFPISGGAFQEHNTLTRNR